MLYFINKGANEIKVFIMKSKKVVWVAVLSAISLIMFMIESLFPPLFVTGAKMGLSNIPSLLVLFTAGTPYSFVILFVRIILGSLVTGSMSTLVYSLPAGIISLSVAAVIKLFVKSSVVCTSVASAVVHNIVQNTLFIFISQTPQMTGYYPHLALIGILAGAVTGIAVTLLIRSKPVMQALQKLRLN